MEKINEIIDFWFSDVDDDTPPNKAQPVSKKWFVRDDAFDQEIIQRFGEDVIKAKNDEYKDWEQSALGRLALIILLDQFTRNIYRNDARSFESDAQALNITLQSIKDGLDQDLNLTQRHFLYLPFMHSEKIEIQKKSMEYFAKLVDEAKENNKTNKIAQLESVLEFAQKHYDIVEKFDRFPHRNEVLGRQSTAQELAFLNDHGKGF